ncbi:hypothetical protein PN36_01280 [Candidatus Thiomargarita nelsonii]|uniref:Uncharacterized protein n=1 Tax=Candidatus Thiomargarita nelsonii TaxID=1003181 RepID=A0A4E0QXJ8_9GAMM|nr:hypothetical protein PN36_01280 [Candidatus Thiomargarita nelsonii]
MTDKWHGQNVQNPSHWQIDLGIKSPLPSNAIKLRFFVGWVEQSETHQTFEIYNNGGLGVPPLRCAFALPTLQYLLT